MIENKQFNEIQTTLLKLVEKDLFGNDYIPDKDTDWQAVFKESGHQAIMLSVYNVAEKAIPDELRKKVENVAMRKFHRNLMIHNNHTILHELMTDNKIPYCVLKGCSSSYYYPDFCLRAMGDVDFLIRKEDIPKATQVLKDAGFESSGEDHGFHIAFHKEKIYLEMHYAPPGMPEGRSGELVRSYLEDIFEKSELIQKESAVFQKPSDFHHGLVILMHTYSHLLKEGVGLRHLIDLAVFFDHFSDEDFKDIFYERLSAAGLWRFTQIMGCVSYQYLGLPYRSWMGSVDEKLCADVMGDIFSGGNFGKKDKDRRSQGLLIFNQGKSAIEKKSFFQIFSVINESAKKSLASLYKVKILRPLAWGIVCIRFTYHLLTGQTISIHVDSLFSEAEKRKAIYKQFQLFETDEK